MEREIPRARHETGCATEGAQFLAEPYRRNPYPFRQPPRDVGAQGSTTEMTILTDKEIFDAIRARRGSALSQEHVDAINAILYPNEQTATPAAPAPASGDPIPADYFDILAKIESGNRPYIKAGTSSASGLYQFIRSTWRGEGGAWGSDMSQAFGGLRPSIEEQKQRARSFTMKNVAALRNAGVPINSATLYAAHFLGAGTAIKMLKAPVTAPAASIAGPDATKANPSILSGRTVADFRTWLEKKTGARP
ncbi:MAG: hypothetical protein C0510_06870 [Erythrobacter sp.]|nr:hypothetical protein [Erythrobacter sp.]